MEYCDWLYAEFSVETNQIKRQGHIYMFTVVRRRFVFRGGCISGPYHHESKTHNQETHKPKDIFSLGCLHLGFLIFH